MSPKLAMCAHLGCDSIRDMEDSYRYQPKPRERYPLYSMDDYMYTYGDKPMGDTWEADPDQFYARQANTVIWRQKRTK